MSICHLPKSKQFLDDEVEIIENKGIGHPDSICDSISKEASRQYSIYCLKNFGVILHHYFDNVSIVGASSEIEFGKSKLTSKIKVFIHGAASYSFGEQEIPVEEILISAVKNTFKYCTPNIPFHTSVQVNIELANTKNVFTRKLDWYSPKNKDQLMLESSTTAVDTCCVTSYWPLTKCEQLSQLLNQYLSIDIHSEFNNIGTDTKHLISRLSDNLKIVVNVPLLADKTPSELAYTRTLEKIRSKVETIINSIGYSQSDYLLIINPGTPYLAVYSGALELRDVGSTGRGNKENGMISSFRPFSMECPNGKNVRNYGGSYFSVVAKRIAKELNNKFNKRFIVTIVSILGDNMMNPSQVLIQCSGDYDRSLSEDIINKILNQQEINISYYLDKNE